MSRKDSSRQQSRPAGSTRDAGDDVSAAWGEWTAQDLGERPVSEKRVRKVRSGLVGRQDTPEPDGPEAERDQMDTL